PSTPRIRIPVRKRNVVGRRRVHNAERSAAAPCFAGKRGVAVYVADVEPEIECFARSGREVESSTAALHSVHGLHALAVLETEAREVAERVGPAACGHVMLPDRSILKYRSASRILHRD